MHAQLLIWEQSTGRHVRHGEISSTEVLIAIAAKIPDLWPMVLDLSHRLIWCHPDCVRAAVNAVAPDAPKKRARVTRRTIPSHAIPDGAAIGLPVLA